MDSSQIQQRLYQAESDEFLNIPMQPVNFPIISKQIQGHQETPKSQKNSANKHKGIEKSSKTTEKKHKPPKRRKDQSANTQMGRPSNEDIEKDHLTINRSFNDIIYHFARLMIFLKLKQGIQTSMHAMELQNYQSAWMSEAESIMNLENFPTYESEKPAFLLHPNSLHFLFYYRLQNQNKISYNEQEVKYMLLAFLKKRKMLSSTIYHYVNNYWPDIVYLVNNPEGNDQLQHDFMQIYNSDRVEDIAISEQMYQNRENNTHKLIKNQKSKQDESAKSNSKSKKQVSQMQALKKQLAEDDSIGAYQIACYLHACCLKFNLTIGKGL